MLGQAEWICLGIMALYLGAFACGHMRLSLLRVDSSTRERPARISTSLMVPKAPDPTAVPMAASEPNRPSARERCCPERPVRRDQVAKMKSSCVAIVIKMSRFRLTAI